MSNARQDYDQFDEREITRNRSIELMKLRFLHISKGDPKGGSRDSRGRKRIVGNGNVRKEIEYSYRIQTCPSLSKFVIRLRPVQNGAVSKDSDWKEIGIVPLGTKDKIKESADILSIAFIYSYKTRTKRFHFRWTARKSKEAREEGMTYQHGISRCRRKT
jgi:hypothetical protein